MRRLSLQLRLCSSSASASLFPNTLVFSHPLCEGHDVPNHPERPQRVQAVAQALEARWPGLEPRVAPEASLESLKRAHTASHVEILQSMFEASKSRHIAIDGDTTVMEGTRDAVLRASGAVCAAVDAVIGSLSWMNFTPS